MKICMLKTQNGSPNGIRVVTYKKDVEYDIPDSLANVFIKMKVAEIVKTTDVAKGIKQVNKSDEKKVLEPKYENKVLESGYVDKKNKKEK